MKPFPTQTLHHYGKVYLAYLRQINFYILILWSLKLTPNHLYSQIIGADLGTRLYFRIVIIVYFQVIRESVIMPSRPPKNT